MLCFKTYIQPEADFIITNIEQVQGFLPVYTVQNSSYKHTKTKSPDGSENKYYCSRTSSSIRKSNLQRITRTQIHEAHVKVFERKRNNMNVCRHQMLLYLFNIYLTRWWSEFEPLGHQEAPRSLKHQTAGISHHLSVPGMIFFLPWSRWFHFTSSQTDL